MGGEFPASLPTAALDAASLLKGDTSPAAGAGARGRRPEAAKRPRTRHERKETCEEEGDE